MHGGSSGKMAGIMRSIGVGSAAQIHRFVTGSLAAVGPDRPLLLLTSLLAFISATLQTLLFICISMLAVAISTSQAKTVILPLWFVRLHLQISEIAAASLVLVLSILAISWPLASCQASLASRAVARAQHNLIQAFLSTTQAHRQRLREGFLAQLMGEYCQQLVATVRSFNSFCVATTTLAALLLLPLALSPKIAVIMFGAAGCCFLLIGPLAEKMRHDSLARSTVNRAVSSEASQIARTADEVYSFNVASEVELGISSKIDAASTVLAESTFAEALLPSLYQFGTLAIVIAFVSGLLLVDPGRHPNLAAFALLMFRAIGYGRQLIGAIQNGSKAAPYVERLYDDIADLRSHARVPGTVRQFEFRGLQVNDLSFAYGQGSPVLTNISCSFPARGAVGIVGSSGGGKSTLCTLLSGVRTGTGGEVSSGGIPIKDIAPDIWWSTTALVPQDTKLISGTVAENILFFRPGYTRDDVEAAGKAAHIHDEIMAFPNAYDTRIGPGGRGLSGGQRQRLVIARSLLGRPAFLVLDEPSSALDRVSEALVSLTLRALKREMLIVIVTHRPATLAICDQVFTLEQGCLRADDHPEPGSQ